MNKKIEELAERASLELYGDTAQHRLLKGFAEKFAELIINECIAAAKNPQWYDESPSCGWRNPIRHVCNAFKEYFGVE